MRRIGPLPRPHDLELVICDNVSDDGTIGALEEYARADRRIRLGVNPVNIGLSENMRQVLDLAQGTFFRWISADDWLEAGSLSACVQALESRPDAIGVTTSFTIQAQDGSTRYEDYGGEFRTSADPVRRFERMLWFFHAGDAKYDPIYSDWLLAAELALMGRSCTSASGSRTVRRITRPSSTEPR